MNRTSQKVENNDDTNRLMKDISSKCKISVTINGDPLDNNNSEECNNNNNTMVITGKKNPSVGPELTNFDDSASNDEGYELSSASGRSSSTSSNIDEQRTDSPDSSKTSLNPNSNLFPHKFVYLAEQLRVRFLKEFDEEDDKDSYDQYDVDELRKQIIPVSCEKTGEGFKPEQSVAFRWISRFINIKTLLEPQEDKIKQEVNESQERFKEFMKFRAIMGLSHLGPDQFAREFYILSGIFPFGVDKSGVPVLYLRARIHRRWSPKLNDMFQRYVAWQIDLITKSNPGAQVNATVGSSGREKDGSFGICFDCLSVSYSCLDMDFLRYLVRLLVHSYPTYCRYALCVDLPWIFRSVWKLVRSWLPEDAQNSVQLITSKQLTEFIDEDQLPNSMKFNDLKASEKPTKNKHQLPKGFSSLRGIKEFADELKLGQSELKQFMSHVDKINKEYQQLGAI